MASDLQGDMERLKKHYLTLTSSPDYFDNPAKQDEAEGIKKQIEKLKKRLQKAEETNTQNDLAEQRDAIWEEHLTPWFYVKRAEKTTENSSLMLRKNQTDMSLTPIDFCEGSLAEKLLNRPKLMEPVIQLTSTFIAKKDGGVEENYARALRWLLDYMKLRHKNILSGVPNWSNDSKQPCIHYIPLEIEAGPTPCWDQFLDRLDLRDEFLAFLWGVFDVRDRGRQVFWIRDSGAGGKSSVVRAVESWLGDAAKSIGLDNFKNTHGAEDIIHRRLLIDPDSNLVFAISDGMVHKITGGDTINVNPKGKRMYSVNMFAKILFMSNYLPSISQDKKNERTRLILSELRPRDKNIQGQDIRWEQGLTDERKQLLFKAKEAYERLVKNFEISTERVNYSLIETGEIEFIHDFLQKNGYVLDPRAKISRNELLHKLDKAFKSRNSERSNLLSFRDTYQRFLVENGVTYLRKRNPLGGETTTLVGIGVVEETSGKIPAEVNPTEEEVLL
jgi:hypothetical protein